MARFGIRTERGVSMLEVIGIVAALMSLVIGLNYKTTDFFNKSQALDSNALLRLADKQLRQYVVTNGRLPCPDLNGDGIAAAACNGTQQKGYLPYITLGMVENNYGFNQVPMLYGAYNDGSIALTSNVQTFFPSYADTANVPVAVTSPPNSRNIFDFCKSLADLKTASAATSGLAVSNTDGSVAYQAAYALALPGQANRDGLAAGWAGGPAVNAQYDGLNGSSANRFDMPQVPVTPTYDDRTQFRTAQDLHDSLRCEATNSSVTLLAEAVTIQKETEDFAAGNADDVRSGLLMNSIGVLLGMWEVGQAVAEISSAAEVLGISSGLLAGVSATCPIPPFVACALIPVYATAVASAGTGQGAAIAAAVTAAIGLGLQITAKVLYENLQSRTTITPAAPTLSLARIEPSKVAALKAAYSSSNAVAQTAFSLVPIPAPDKTALDNAQLARAAAVDGLLAAVTDSRLKTVLSGNLNGNTSTCVPPADCSTYTTRQVPKLDGNNNFILSSDGSLVMTPIYTRDNLNAPYAPGLEPGLASYYQALAQAGANASPGATITSTSTDPAVLAAQAQLKAASDALAAAPVVDPATALSRSNSVVTAYNVLLAATADFDAKNLSYEVAQSNSDNADAAAGSATSGSAYDAKVAAQNALSSAATARSEALGALRTAMGAGYESWSHAGNTSLCGGGATTGCGWMRDAAASANAGSASSRASTASSAVNNYLTAYNAYQAAAAYQKFKDTADTKARMAWSDRNSYKTVLCATASPSLTWLGGAIAILNPASWDGSEDLLASPASGLSCAGSALAADLSSNSAAARAAEKTKYCPGGSAPDSALCTLYSSTAATQSTIQGAEAIVNALIQKGIVK